ncbi:inducible serine protease inhibitor 2-like [Achroia grisella]|uniref:inducible serine protease inhibitor 2-like n=1 Tax=Achroia grisella TaxID=688607 RepID=UPI0027D27990|nr:inducible serine protease inhibitor 2-like [Achroia grisella]
MVGTMQKLLLIFLLVSFSVNILSLDPICKLPLETGICRAEFYRFGYDAKLKECRQFLYGGCRGNENNFKTFEACQAVCQ